MGNDIENNFIEAAKKLQAHGFYVFPLVPNGKKAAVSEYSEVASRDPKKVDRWWTCPLLGVCREYNIGISPTRFGDNEKILAIDVDVKNGKDGATELFKLELQGKVFPPTFTTFTTTGGMHLLYRTKALVGNSVGRLAEGIDTRGTGGIIVAPGSEIDGKKYTADFIPLAEAPEWMVLACQTVEKNHLPAVEDVNPALAEKRAKEYLATAPAAIEFEGANQTTYNVACRLKDYGVDAMSALDLMLNHWNARNSRPWDDDQLAAIIANAYSYGRDRVGSLAPESVFDDLPDDATVKWDNVSGCTEPEKPKNQIELFNDEFAFVLSGGSHHILFETQDAAGREVVEHLSELSFHKLFASKKTIIEDKPVPWTKLWMASSKRRTYHGFCFRPLLPTPDRFYNLFRGWAVEPLPQDEKPTQRSQDALDALLAHTLENICDGNAEHAAWVTGFFAHLVQRPFEKPLVALVLRGEKGVGKNALIDRIDYLLGRHSLVTAHKRFLESNFNAHIENLLLFGLNEAFWSGDKKTDGILKDLITGNTHTIERKGKEAYYVDNLCRVVVMGNDKWVVPASEDERRYAVFDVGNGRKQDRKFFRDIQEGMEAGGYRLLLRYLQQYDISDIDVNQAPATKGLLRQKLQSGNPVEQWWHESLSEGFIKESVVSEEWPDRISKTEFRESLHRYVRNLGIRRLPLDRDTISLVKKMSPSFNNNTKIRQDNTTTIHAHKLPSLETARKEFARFLGHEMEWT